MNRRFLCLALAVLSIVTFCACQSREAVIITSEEGRCVQSLIDGVIECDAAKWRSAFLPAYDKAYEAQELELGTCTDYNVYIQQNITEALDVLTDNYGDNLKIELADEVVTHTEMSALPEYFEDYKDIFTLRYALDLTTVEGVATIEGSLNIWGDKNSDSRTARYVLIKFDGVWYLHPAFYNYMFQ